MGTKFTDFMREIEAEASREGPEAVAELEALREHFRIGRQVAEARLAKRMTQTQVAQLADVDQSDVSNIERGAANPTVATLSAVASAVGLEINLQGNPFGRRSKGLFIDASPTLLAALDELARRKTNRAMSRSEVARELLDRATRVDSKQGRKSKM